MSALNGSNIACIQRLLDGGVPLCVVTSLLRRRDGGRESTTEWTDEDALALSVEKRNAIAAAFRVEGATQAEWNGFNGSGVYAYWRLDLVWPGFQT